MTNQIADGKLLKSFGWIHILDLVDITSARGAEMYLPLWVRMYGALTDQRNVHYKDAK